MNTRTGPSGKSMNPRRFSLRGGVALLAAAGVLPLLAAAAETDQPIVASLNPPPAGLACDAAAAATSVYFQFANPPFEVSQISLYLDGKGVAQDAIEDHWPTVTMTKGLHPGTNTVDIVANGNSGQHIERRMVVQVGGAAAGGNGSAQVNCDDGTTVAQAPQPQAVVPADAPEVVDETAPSVVGGDEPEPVVVEDNPPVVYEQPPAVVYSYPAPVYVYNPYPVVAIDPWIPLVPFFGFGFFYSHYHPWYAPPRVVYNNYYHGGGWGGGGGWHGGGGGWHGGGPGPGWHGNPGGGWHGGGPGNNHGPYPTPGPGWHGGPRPGPSPQPTFNGGGRPGGAPNGGWRGNPGGGNGWHGAPQAPRPVQRPMPQQQHSSWQGQRFGGAPQFRAPQQSFRPVNSAPAFRGGGGFGGGFHGAPAGGGFHGGGGAHGGGGGGRHH